MSTAINVNFNGLDKPKCKKKIFVQQLILLFRSMDSQECIPNASAFST